MILYLFGILLVACRPDSQTKDDLDIDNDGFVAIDDCDDTNPNIYPNADELCDGVDNDCDDVIDEDDAIGAVAWFADTDSDGFGDPNSSVVTCNQPDGYVADDRDCLDTNAEVYPGADEYCDGVDNDCDGATDEDSALDSQLFYRDVDGDGFGNPYIFEHSCDAEPGYVSNNEDCNDSDELVYPGAPEICDEIDNDCDESIDDQDSDITDAPSWYVDSDGDGFGSGTATVRCLPPLPGQVNNADDCNDLTALISPAAVEWCGDGLDNDCDGFIDIDDTDAQAVAWFADIDGDGFGDPATILVIDCEGQLGAAPNSLDCDDGNAEISPAATEVWYDGVDQDCAGDDDNDADADGVAGEAAGGLDCNDSNPEIAPGLPDICGDEIDNNCDELGDVCAQSEDLESPHSTGQFGGSVVSLGDHDGDGVEAIVVGASGSDELIQGGGAAYFYTDPTQDPMLMIYGDQQGLHAGSRVAYGGDLSGDSAADIVVVAYGADFGGIDSGSAYIISTTNSGELSLADVEVRVDGQGAGDYLGRSILAGLDMNDDGQSDLILGAPYADLNGGDSGAVYMLTGPIDSSRSVSEAAVTLVGGELGEQTGQALTVADVNGDGLLDYAVGAPVNSTNGYAGMLYVVHAPVDPYVLLSTAAGKWNGEANNSRLGEAVVSQLDYTGDGIDDIFVGAPEWDNGHGAVYLLEGSTAFSGGVENSWLHLYGMEAGGRFGATLAVHDLDNNGEHDLVIGAPESSQQGSLDGSIFVLFDGHGEGLQVADAVLYPEDANGLAGMALASGLNGVWIGAPATDSFDGALLLLSGLQ